MSRVNACAWPSFELGTTLATGWDLTPTFTTIHGTPTYSLVNGRRGGYAQRIQYTAVSNDANAKIYFQHDLSAVGSFATNDVITMSCWVKGTQSGVALDLDCLGRWANGTDQSGEYSGVYTLYSDWRRVSCTFTATTVGLSRVESGLFFGSLTNGDTFDVTVDDFLIEKSGTLLDYFDGSFPGSAWDGTANASKSTLTWPAGVPFYLLGGRDAA